MMMKQQNAKDIVLHRNFNIDALNSEEIWGTIIEC